MSEDKKERHRKLIKLIFFKIPIILMVIGAVLIGALKLVEGYPNPLRQGFEEYLSKASGRNATIGKLEEIKFFPNFIIQARDITIHNSLNAAIVDLEIEKITMSTPFWSLFINSKTINSFSIKNLRANEDMLTGKAIEVSSLEIVTKDGPDQFGSFLIAEGKVGKEKANFETKLEVGKYNYRMPSPFSFSLRVGQYEVNATLQNDFKRQTLQNAVFSKGDKVSEARQYILFHKKEFNKDNPLTCILNQKNMSDCDKYLTLKKDKIEN